MSGSPTTPTDRALPKNQQMLKLAEVANQLRFPVPVQEEVGAPCIRGAVASLLSPREGGRDGG